ncbi:Prephenate dehydratase-domain-containing protein, partial [Elsinoe ampelina]
VAYLGPKATYTHQAALQQFPQSSIATLVPSPSIASVFTSVQDGESEYGVVPFENSSNGAVLPTLDLFASLPTSHPDVTIIGEQFVDVHHCLMGRLTNTTEGGTPQIRSQPAPDLQKLTVIHSHPQAWGQCTGLLSSLPNAEKVDSSSTSAAATKIASLVAKSPDGTTTEAAIASKLAAELNNLDILRENIEDRSDNQTRFFVLARKKKDDPSPASPPTTPARARHKTLLHFRVPVHGSPGALADALAVFKKQGLSLSSMYTRP